MSTIHFAAVFGHAEGAARELCGYHWVLAAKLNPGHLVEGRLVEH
jgi:hypothetical protein